MGWSSGSAIAEDLYVKIRKFIPKDKREEISNMIYNMFCEHDADDWDEHSKLCKDGKFLKENE